MQTSYSNSTTALVLSIVAVSVVMVLSVSTLGARYARARGYSYLGEDTVVRCRQGHYFTTIWIPAISFKAVRLGLKRYQRCPLCEHWTVVVPVKDSELTDKIIRVAKQHHDSRLP